MTSEEVNIALAKWHSENQEFTDFRVGRNGETLLWANKEFPTLNAGSFKPYTDSLDTMRMIEELLTDEQWPVYSNAILWGGIYIVPKDILIANAETRARAAVTALGIGSKNE